MKIKLPTKEDFESFDVDQNGILFLEEWLLKVSGQGPIPPPIRG